MRHLHLPDLVMKLTPYCRIQPSAVMYGALNDHTRISACNTPASVCEARLQLDREIYELEHALIRLKTRRNALAPAATLPAEILSNIFLRARDACVEQDPRSKKWVAIAETCRRWRSVAVKFAAFWDHVDLFRPRWADELLIRSKTSPTLSVVASVGTRRDERWLQTAGDLVPRLRSLIVDASDALRTSRYGLGDVHKHLDILLAQPASNIQHFHVVLPAEVGEGVHELNLASPSWAGSVTSFLT